jgi:hypothetical protein
MKERPILFNAHMVSAILDSRKTQTRRVIKSQPIGPVEKLCACWSWADTGSRDPECGGHYGFSCPHGKPGDRLWVRETFCLSGSFPIYRADSNPSTPVRWTPSIFMPRSASRITLEITDVRVERVQAISETDAIAEGIDNIGLEYSIEPWKNYLKAGNGYQKSTPQASYMTLWKSINGHESWDANPWVWVIEFRRVH